MSLTIEQSNEIQNYLSAKSDALEVAFSRLDNNANNILKVRNKIVSRLSENRSAVDLLDEEVESYTDFMQTMSFAFENVYEIINVANRVIQTYIELILAEQKKKEIKNEL